MRWIDRLRWGWLVLTTVTLFSTANVCGFVAGRRHHARIFWRFLKLWGRVSLFTHRPRLEHAARFPRSGPLLIVSNHQSNFDIPLLHGLIPEPFLWLARHDLFGVPFVGLALRRLDCIPVVRNDRRKAMEAFRTALDMLSAGRNVMVFPEGTWGDAEGRMREFKGGVVALARRTGATIVPLTIMGSHHVNPPFTARVNPGPLTVVVHPPIPAADLADLTDVEVLNRLRSIIGSCLPCGEARADISAALADTSPF